MAVLLCGYVLADEGSSAFAERAGGGWHSKVGGLRAPLLCCCTLLTTSSM